MVAAYVRVSTAGQDLEGQRAALRRAARARGVRIDRWFEEKQSGAALCQRPALAELRLAARMGEINTLLVYRLDRLTRSGIRDTLTLVEELRIAGCNVVTIADGFELHGPAGEIVAAVLAWAAQMERQAISDRIKAARERVREEGGAWGRAVALSPFERARVKRMQRNGLSVRKIAAVLKVPKSVIGRCLAPSLKPVATKGPARTAKTGP
jgi:DNA invertase Pin-like site-specific DNA recombinase